MPSNSNNALLPRAVCFVLAWLFGALSLFALLIAESRPIGFGLICGGLSVALLCFGAFAPEAWRRKVLSMLSWPGW